MNKSWFYGMELYVDKAVLIPRPETEELVDWVVKDMKASGIDVFPKEATDADVTTQLKILDIGTGSGCIALALKKMLPKAEVWGCDTSEEALNVARRNGAALDIRVDFQGANFLDEAQQKFLPTVDIIVSNPPYIPLSDSTAMQQNVVGYEPHIALFVPNDDPLLFYKAIAHFARKRLYENGCIYLEIHEALGEGVISLFKAEGYQNVELRKDMQGKDRMLKVVNGK
jgi:release factor glutamine methyltransferase